MNTNFCRIPTNRFRLASIAMRSTVHLAALVGVLAMASSQSFAQDTSGNDVATAQPARQLNTNELCARLLEAMPPLDFDHAFVPDVTMRDLGVLSESLMLDAAQTIILESLLEDYESSFRMRADKVRQQVADLRPASATRRAQLRQAQRRIERNRMLDELRERLQELDADTSITAEERQELIQKVMAEYQQREVERDPTVDESAHREMLEYLSQINDLSQQWNEVRRTLRSQFDADVHALLTHDQIERWGKANQRLRRINTLSWGTLSGEYVQLDKIIDRLDLSEDQHARIDPLFDAYYQALDKALHARNRYLSDYVQLKFDALRRCSISEVFMTIDKLSDLRVAVRNVHDRFAEAIAEEISGFQAARFRSQWRQEAYPIVFAETRATRLLNQSLAIEGLDDPTRSALMDLRLRYDQEHTAIAERMLDSLREEEPKQTRRELEQQIANIQRSPGPFDDNESSLAQIRQERSELHQRAMEELRDLLGEEQFIALLAADAQPRPRPSTDSQPELPHTPQQEQEMFRKYDLNGDGHLDDYELELMQRDIKQRTRDQNRSG